MAEPARRKKPVVLAPTEDLFSFRDDLPDAYEAPPKRKKFEGGIIAPKEVPSRLVPLEVKKLKRTEYLKSRPKRMLERVPPKEKVIRRKRVPGGKALLIKKKTPKDLNAFLARTALDTSSALKAAKGAVPLYIENKELELSMGRRDVFTGLLEEKKPGRIVPSALYPEWVKENHEAFRQQTFEVYFELDKHSWPILERTRFFVVSNNKWHDPTQIRFDLKEFDRVAYEHLCIAIGATICNRNVRTHNLPPESKWYLAVSMMKRRNKDEAKTRFRTSIAGLRYKLLGQRKWDWISLSDKRDQEGWSGIKPSNNWASYARCPKAILGLAEYMCLVISRLRYPLPRLVVKRKVSYPAKFSHDFFDR